MRKLTSFFNRFFGLFFALCLLTSLAYSLLFIFSGPVSAQRRDADPKSQINIGERQGSGDIAGIPAVGNPNATVGNLVANTLQIMAIFGGLAVLFFFVWGAFDWITSGGDKEKVGAARRKITNSLIGLTLLALAAFIVALVGEIVGINPLKMGEIPTLGQQAAPAP